MTDEIDDIKFERTQEVYQVLGITPKIWCEKTGFSETQYRRWHDPKHNTRPSAWQLHRLCVRLDINVQYLWHGIGPMRLSECIEMWNKGAQAWLDLYDYVATGELSSDRAERKAVYQQVISNNIKVDQLHEIFVESPRKHEENWDKIDILMGKVDLLLKRTNVRYDRGA